MSTHSIEGREFSRNSILTHEFSSICMEWVLQYLHFQVSSDNSKIASYSIATCFACLILMFPFKLIFGPFQIDWGQLNKWAHKMQIDCTEHMRLQGSLYCCLTRLMLMPENIANYSRYWITATVSKNVALYTVIAYIWTHVVCSLFIWNMNATRMSMSVFDPNLINGSKHFRNHRATKLNLMMWNVQISTQSINISWKFERKKSIVVFWSQNLKYFAGFRWILTKYTISM